MSSYIKKEGTTSKLLEAADEALNDGRYIAIIDQLEHSHIMTVKELLTGEIKQQVQETIQDELNSVRSFLDAIRVIGEMSPRSHDVIIGTGEKLSACIFSGLLNSMGMDAEYINLESIIKKSFPEEARKLFAQNEDDAKRKYKNYVRQANMDYSE